MILGLHFTAHVYHHHHHHDQYIKILLCVRLSVTDMGVAVTNLRVVCKIIRVVCKSAHVQNGHINLSWDSKNGCKAAAAGLDTQATRRMPLWALTIALATGKNTRLFGVLD